MTKMKNEYDQTKKFLNLIRNLKKKDSLNEQTSDQSQFNNQQPNYGQESQQSNNDPNYTGSEKEDINVINNVEVKIQSSDDADLTLTDEEKTKISQLIDDFRSQVSDITEFNKFNIYPDSVKLDGRIPNLNIGFVLSSGDDNGVYIAPSEMIKLSNETFDLFKKLITFQQSFGTTTNEIIIARKQN